MRKDYLLLAILCFVVTLSNAQSSKLYTPLNIQEAIKSGTRSNNGNPGEAYWQNKADYKISAIVDTGSSILNGDETITYYNNSPDSLRRIVIRLYQDISKPSAVRDWYIGEEGFTEGVKINYIIVEDDTLDILPTSKDIVRLSTNLLVKLKNKLPPNSKISIQIGWQFEIPKIFKIRMGNYGNGNLYVAYWYPQVAVYDDIDGWDYIDYSGSVEFYNDFSNYDVTINVPEGLVVWATGDLQNGKEVFREDIYDKYKQAKLSDETIHIITKEDYDLGVVTAENKTNDWHFKAENIPAVAFATSNSLLWDGASLIVDKLTGRRSLTDVIYKEGDAHYENGAQYARESIEYLSYKLPGFPYPYSHATTYSNGNRGGGMESPMMANNGAPSVLANHIGLLFHEISHNYFPFIMGTNERKYAWMDEGWASFLPTEMVEKYEPDYNYKIKNVASYAKRAGTETDLPLVVPSYSYKTRNMRIGFYSRPANAYFELMELLGENVFQEALLEYVNIWKGKHPIPQDFFNIFNKAAKEDLSWFWKPWFYEFGYPDLAVTNFKQNDDNVTVTINKNGNIPTRVVVTFEYEDGEKEIIEKPVSVWKNGNTELIIDHVSSKSVESVSIGSKYIPDSVEGNNKLNSSE